MTKVSQQSRDVPPVAEPPWLRPRALYVHIPFCAHKCGYCDFASIAGADDLADRYLDALEQEMRRALKGDRPQVATVFLGGGTPTRLDARQLDRLLARLRELVDLTPEGEWTVEANPGTLDAEKVRVLADGGVNRVSLGAQSFQPRALKALERNHDPDDVPRAVDLIRRRFDRWSLDLIFGAPGTTLGQWSTDLDRAIALEPSHLSCYGLVYEKGTSLWKQWNSGSVQAVDEEVEHDMYALTIDRLVGAGLRHYEISNFARPGHESRHNLVYWANDAYYGFGLGATRYVDGIRSSNTRDLLAYLRRIERGEEATGPTERLEPEDRGRETAVLMLRRLELGIDREDFRRRCGLDLDDLCGESLARSVARGWLIDDGRRLKLSRNGLFLADTVMSDLL